jgi:hypothetical protein
MRAFYLLTMTRSSDRILVAICFDTLTPGIPSSVELAHAPGKRFHLVVS